MNGEKTNIFQEAIRCIDATYQNDPAAALDSSEILSAVDDLMMEFRKRFEIPADVEIGNCDAVEDNWDVFHKASVELEIKIFELCWDHVKDLMLNCGLGDIAREVFASQILQTPLSWDVREKALAERKR